MWLLSELRRRNVVRVGAAYAAASWLLIQLVETIAPAFGAGTGAVRVVVIILAIGLIPISIFAWVYEITPTGLKLEKEITASESITRRTGKQLDRIFMVLLALALGYFAIDKFVIDPARDAEREQAVARQARTDALIESYGDKSIAVLPFLNMSADENQEYFSDGVSEELLNALAQIQDLRVISRSSAFSYKDKDIDIPTIARELNVAHILEGSVRKVDNQVRITAQLIEAQSDTHLWSETYDRTLDDIFETQADIAARVAEQLKLTLLRDPRQQSSVDPEAYALMLQARHVGTQNTPEAWEASNDLFEQALAIAPDYADAWIGLSKNYSNQAYAAAVPYVEGYTRARNAATRALELAPQSGEVHGLIGGLELRFDHNLQAAAHHLQKAYELDPTNLALIADIGLLARQLGRNDAAIAFNEYAVERDPVNATRNLMLSISYLMAGRLDEAIDSGQTAASLSPGFVTSEYWTGVALLLKGDLQESLATMQRESHPAWRLIGTAMAHHAVGQVDESDAALAELIEKGAMIAPFNIAYVCAYRGEVDRAFQWLNKAVEYEDPGLHDVMTEPMLATLHSDPRWFPFLERVGKTPASAAAISFNVKLPD